MPSPIVHAALGAGAALAFLPRKRASVLAGAALVALSCWPDVDYVPGLLAGVLNQFHQGFTHSFLFALAGVPLAYPFLRRAMPREVPARPIVAVLLLVALSHLLFDALTQDFRPPIGIPLFWPFTDLPVHSPWSLFPAWAKGTLRDLLNPSNLRAAAIELGYAIPLLVLPPLAARCRKRRTP